ncbi:MAG: hypothetical protein AB3N64_01475 [Puniceicoccaceae bacterium]
MKSRILPLLLVSGFLFAALGRAGTVIEKADSGLHAEDRSTTKHSDDDIDKFRARGFVRYSDLGAVGDGKTDDIDAIAATHALANLHGLKVKADSGATYYIGGKERTAVIRTDTDFGSAAFIIDDRKVENRSAFVFMVDSSLEPFEVTGLSSLEKNQADLGITLPQSCLVTVTNDNRKHYIRFGLNPNKGSSQLDVFIVGRDGAVDPRTPIIWDFEQITEISARPIDDEVLTISGGHFTTIANQAESKYTYYKRGIGIQRSNVVVDGFEHRITGEGDHGAPYGGFISISDCAFVTVQNTVLTGHKTYRTIGRAGLPVSMGTYDILVARALNVSFVNCRQTNDIKDDRYWGIMGSNYCKNLVYDRCALSRFDAHRGVANATIRNSTLGHMGINAIGTGTFIIENTTIHCSHFFNLRADYGSTWQGDVIIRNCVFVPTFGQNSSGVLINGTYSGQHDFGYTCYMPERIIIENLHIQDSVHPEEYPGPAIFAEFNPENTDASYIEKFPYVTTKEVVLKEVTIDSGKPLRVSDNPFLFRSVDIRTD